MTEHTSRDRLLAAGKALFARSGYEQASTASIAREAGTSESQLVRYFGTKSGLLEAIFNESWTALNARITPLAASAEHSRDALARILGFLITTLDEDHDLAFLIFFEGRRVRGQEVALSKGFLSFYGMVHDLIRMGQSDGSFRTDLSVDVIASALVGCAEGMMRDRMIAQRTGHPIASDEAGIQKAFETVVNAFAPAKR